MNTINVIESYLHDKLTAPRAKELAKVPLVQLGDFISRVGCFQDAWLREKIPQRQSDASEVSYCIIPGASVLSWEKQLSLAKAFLLYFPRVAIPDPLDGIIAPMLFVSQMFGGEIRISDEQKLRADLSAALAILAELRPFVESKEVLLVPPSIGLEDIIQDRAHAEIESIEAAIDDPYSGAMVERPDRDNTICHGHICSLLGYTPVASSRAVRECLRIEYQRTGLAQSPGIDWRATEVSIAFGVPGAQDAKVRDILRLRGNEEAFANWRSELGEIFSMVHRESPENVDEFENEFKRAAEDRLRPKIDELDKAMRGSPALLGILQPAALSIGGYAIGAQLMGADPNALIAAAVAAGLAPASWVAEKLYKRLTRKGRTAGLLKEFYGFLIAQ